MHRTGEMEEQRLEPGGVQNPRNPEERSWAGLNPHFRRSGWEKERGITEDVWQTRLYGRNWSVYVVPGDPGDAGSLLGGVRVPLCGCGADSLWRGGGWLKDLVFLIWGPNPSESGSLRLQARDRTSCFNRGSSLASKLDMILVFSFDWRFCISLFSRWRRIFSKVC
jgi:hypothetical protein